MLIRSNLKAALTALVAAAAASAGGVLAQDGAAPGTRAESPVVVERASDGRATQVRIGETVYPVCQTERQDGCIQPRAAGLGWGDRPLQHWPGEPASKRQSRTDRASQSGR
jgi:hypothetical protein